MRFFTVPPFIYSKRDREDMDSDVVQNESIQKLEAAWAHAAFVLAFILVGVFLWQRGNDVLGAVYMIIGVGVAANTLSEFAWTRLHAFFERRSSETGPDRDLAPSGFSNDIKVVATFTVILALLIGIWHVLTVYFGLVPVALAVTFVIAVGCVGVLCFTLFDALSNADLGEFRPG
jgi:hypothetical protein